MAFPPGWNINIQATILCDFEEFLYNVVTILVSSDFDDDGTLDCGDLEKLVNCLTGETEDTRLTPDEMRQLINNVSSEASLPWGLVGCSAEIYGLHVC